MKQGLFSDFETGRYKGHTRNGGQCTVIMVVPAAWLNYKILGCYIGCMFEKKRI